MRIAFLDRVGWAYDAGTPYDQPLGGTQSAICYLTVELARLGHDVTVLNGIAAPTASRGVLFRNYSDSLAAGFLNAFDAVIVSCDAIGEAIRRGLRVTVPLILWNHFGTDEAAVSALARPAERDAWTAFAFISQWQREQYEARFAIARGRSRILRNAVAPAFAELPEIAPWFATGAPPTLFYSSPPYRGLDVLLQAFPTIRAAMPDVRLRVFSGMGIYRVRPEDDHYRALYAHAESLDGVDYVGVVGQQRLARELSGAAALAYPSTVAESACIAALEAMATGASVVGTRLGALPETTGNFGFLVEPRADKAELALHFAGMTMAVLTAMRLNPAAAAARRTEQLAFIRANYLWPARAREWAEWLGGIAG